MRYIPHAMRSMLNYLANRPFFFLTISEGYEIIKIMKRDFWNGIRPLGHVTLLALSEDF